MRPFIIILRKDFKELFQNRQIVFAIIILPIILLLLPSLGLTYFALLAKNNSDFSLKIASILNINGDVDEMPLEIVTFAYLSLAKSLYILLPIIFATMICANSLVIEKERKTIESLLFAPLKCSTLIKVKIFSIFLFNYFLCLISILVFSLFALSLPYFLFSIVIFPSVEWLIIIFLYTPSFIILVSFFIILATSKLDSFLVAQQKSALIIFPFSIVGALSVYLGMIWLIIISMLFILLTVLIYKKTINSYASDKIL